MRKYQRSIAVSRGDETRSEDDDSNVAEASTSGAGARHSALDRTPIDLNKEEIEDLANKEEPHMCLDFARSACIRGSACTYAHKIIVSQLPSMYTFCNDYQYMNCTVSPCNLLHVSVFEKEWFYRTGFLPSHVLAHLNKVNDLKLVPPPTDGGRARAPAGYLDTLDGPLVQPTRETGGSPSGSCGEWRAAGSVLPAAAASDTNNREHLSVDQ